MIGLIANSVLFAWLVLPLLIFSARVIDVSLDTIRIILVSRGYRHVAPFVGFFEILIWLIAITQIMQNLKHPLCYVAYRRDKLRQRGCFPTTSKLEKFHLWKSS
jgi:hypothetical protein